MSPATAVTGWVERFGGKNHDLFTRDSSIFAKHDNSKTSLIIKGSRSAGFILQTLTKRSEIWVIWMTTIQAVSFTKSGDWAYPYLKFLNVDNVRHCCHHAAIMFFSHC